MEFAEAKAIAEKYLAILAPYCERITIAGSIRRQRPHVNDIEIVCIPRVKDLYEFAGIVRSWKKVKGEPTGRYKQRILPEGITLDLFMATVNNWGLIFAIRTGSADFSRLVLARGWVKRGYHSEGGVLYAQDRSPRYIREEIDLFDLIGIPIIDPARREA